MKNSISAVIVLIMGLPIYVGAQVPSECAYVSNEPGAELEARGPCAVVRDGTVSLSPDHFKKLSFGAEGLATILIGAHHYYVNLAGALLPVIPNDNWADSFSEGVVRSQVGAKIAFFDRHFVRVIEPRYDWAWPFQKGRALVCVACAPGPPDGDGHRQVTGGRWGYIDHQGTEIVPVQLSQDEAKKQQ